MKTMRAFLIVASALCSTAAFAAVNLVEGATESPWSVVTTTPAGWIDGMLSGEGPVILGQYADEAKIDSASLSGYTPYGSASAGSEVGLWYAESYVTLGPAVINGRAIAQGLAHFYTDGSQLSIAWDANTVGDAGNSASWSVTLQDESGHFVATYYQSKSGANGAETLNLVPGQTYHLTWLLDVSAWYLYGDYASCNLTLDLADLGDPPAGAPAPVYRFWSPVHARHFYTISKAEKDRIIANYPLSVWTYESVAFQAYPDSKDPDVLPVYRFWSPVLSGHFYTMSESEKSKLIDTYSHVWTYEGVAFYAYPEGSQPTQARAVHRFWSPRHHGHFYTISQDEKDRLIATYPAEVWTYESIAWYAYE